VRYGNVATTGTISSPLDSAACVTGTWSASNFQRAAIPLRSSAVLCDICEKGAGGREAFKMASRVVGIGCLVNLSQTLGEVKPFLADRLAWSPTVIT
jgi:hypothetical protein